jgi:hypothetical protein
MGDYKVIQSEECARVYRNGAEVAQAIPTETGTYFATNVNGKWVGHEHETGLTLGEWVARFTK